MTGAYIHVVPTSETVSMIRRITRGVNLPLYPNSELHCTVMYCVDPDPNAGFLAEKADHFCEEGPFSAYADNVDIWDSQGGSKIVVLRLRSMDLVMRHEFWVKQGLRSTFPVYNPHVTLCDNVTNPLQLAELAGTVAVMNAVLRGSVGQDKFLFRRERMKESKPEKVRKSALPTRPDDVVVAAKRKKKKPGTKKMGDKKSSMPGIPSLNIGPVPAPRAHPPELDDAETLSLKRNGFNVDSHKRLLDGVNKL